MLVLAVTLVVGVLSPGTASAGQVCAPGPTVEGIDVSNHQGDVDWAQVKAAAGKQFGYAKALEGISFPDETFHDNYAEMKAAGVKRGAYLFFRPIADADTQAYLFLEILQQNGFGAGDLIPAIDVEVTDGRPISTVLEKLARVEEIIQNGIGVAPVIYTNPNVWRTVLGSPAGYEANPLWIAHYDVTCPDVPGAFGTWQFHQRTDRGTVPGVTGFADLNRFNGTVGQLPSYTQKAPAFYADTPPTPATVGMPYGYRFRATGSPAPTFALHSGALPPGLVLDSATGSLSGAPTTAGSYSFQIRASNGVAPNAVTPSRPVSILVAPPAAGFHPIGPTRALDSRGSTGGWNATPVTAGTDRLLTVVGGTTGVPANATAVVMNMTVTDSNAGSFLTVYPAGPNRPNASNLNFNAGQVIPNLVTVRVGTGGQVGIATAVGSTNVVADIVGYYDDGTGTPGDRFNGVAPTRILDSRGPNGGWSGPIASGVANTRPLQVTGRGGVPNGATAVVMNVTATNSSAQTFLQVWPTGAQRPPQSSNLNVLPGETIPNLVTSKLGTNGTVSFFNAEGSVNVIVDVVGYYHPAQGGWFHSLPTPTRVLDTRVNNGLSGRNQPGESRSLVVTGQKGIPTGATGIVMNTTVADATAESFVTVYPGDAGRPSASNLNFQAGQVIPNLVMVPVPPDGSVAFYNHLGAVHLIADAVGYFAP